MGTTIKNISIEIIDKHKLYRPDVKVKNLAIESYENPYPADISDITAVNEANNGGFTGFNDWGYLIVPPTNPQINQYVSEDGIDYDEIISIAAGVGDITVTNTAGILTNFNYTQT